MNPFDLHGRTAVVTGGTRGIGLMIARGLLEAGAEVVVSSRDHEACVRAAGALAAVGTASAVPSDLSTADGCRALAEVIGERHDRVDILVNNAGAVWAAPLEEFPDNGWDKILAINLRAPFHLTQSLLPLLTRHATAADPARVVNVGSIDGLRVSPFPIYSYGASKAGLHHLTVMLARDLGPKHITVNAIAPGAFATKMTAAALDTEQPRIVAATPLGRLGGEADIAGAVVFLSSRAGSFVTGAVLPVDGGLATTR